MKPKANTLKVERKKRKRTARVICHDQNEYWTTQDQFWQWVREHKVVKLHHNPLTGIFTHPHEETMVVISNTILNRAHPNHLVETLTSRRFMKPRKSK